MIEGVNEILDLFILGFRWKSDIPCRSSCTCWGWRCLDWGLIRKSDLFRGEMWDFIAIKMERKMLSVNFGHRFLFYQSFKQFCWLGDWYFWARVESHSFARVSEADHDWDCFYDRFTLRLKLYYVWKGFSELKGGLMTVGLTEKTWLNSTSFF